MNNKLDGATVTEAHRKLASDLCRSATGSNRAIHHVPQFAQLIADSEAKACAQLRAEVERLREWQAGVIANEREHHAERKQAIARAERAEAEVKKLTGFYNEIVVECGHDRIVREYRQRGELLRDEANRRKEAEAELANIRALANRRNKRDHSQDTTHQLVAALDQALDIAQAELAAERARLRQLALDACRAAAIVPLVWYPEGYYVNPNDLGKINKQQVDACVAAIDAAMKEETK